MRLSNKFLRRPAGTALIDVTAYETVGSTTLNVNRDNVILRTSDFPSTDVLMQRGEDMRRANSSFVNFGSPTMNYGSAVLGYFFLLGETIRGELATSDMSAIQATMLAESILETLSTKYRPGLRLDTAVKRKTRFEAYKGVPVLQAAVLGMVGFRGPVAITKDASPCSFLLDNGDMKVGIPSEGSSYSGSVLRLGSEIDTPGWDKLYYFPLAGNLAVGSTMICSMAVSLLSPMIERDQVVITGPTNINVAGV